MKSLNGDHAGSRVLGIQHLDSIGIYRETTNERLMLIRAAGNVLKNIHKPVHFHAPTWYTSTKMFIGELSTVFVDDRIGSAI